MRFDTLHRWPRTSQAAIALQKQLAPRVRLVRVPRAVRTIAGVDAAFSKDGEHVIAAVVVYDLVARRPVETRTALAPCRFPYIPGLLSFRELPGVLAAVRKLNATPDAFMCDAHGLAHPRRFGLACHLGLWLGVPTIGCAKSRLCGTADHPAPSKGCSTRLMLKGDQVGIVLRTRDDVKPVFVSPGHLCDHASAKRLTLAATTQYRLPEPTRLADQLVGRVRARAKY
ncbi:MAG: endonuclease V [Planctomycetes bacterium]|nr:endonuclease V [Planctomycetota bacterium]